MELSDYARPPHDNGRGMHWSAGNPAALGMETIRAVWIPRLKAMNVTWVKLLHDGGLALAEELLKHGIMPIVRLYRPAPNPGCLHGALLDALRAFAQSGVRYLEVNNEPNLVEEWAGGKVPPDARRLVAENWLRDAEEVYAVGGYPALPAMSLGADGWDLVGELAALGHLDMLDAGAWIAIHNYTINHPLDYPDDDVNRRGRPLSASEYNAAGHWAWDGESIEQINARRAATANPVGAILDDHTCFREFEYYDALCRKHLGRSLPIISTEGGPVVGNRDDRRYPRVTPTAHSELATGIFDFMQTRAPAYYFSCCAWLLANFELGSGAAAWEGQAWYTHWWDAAFGLEGELPAVKAVEAMRSLPRLENSPQDSIILGRIAGAGAGLVITLRALGFQSFTATDDQGAFAFTALPAGTYSLYIGNTMVREGLDVDGKSSTDLRDIALPASGEQPLEWDARLDALKVSVIKANPPAGVTYWRLVKATHDPGARGRSLIYCEVQDEKGERLVGQKLTLSWPGGSGHAVTENKPTPEFAANFGIGDSYKPDHGPGPFSVSVDGLPSDRVTGMGRPDGHDVIFYLTWRRSTSGPLVAKSVIRGMVVGGQAGQTVILRAATGEVRQTTLDGAGAYVFRDLPAGTYTLEVAGTSVPDLQVDGTSGLDVPLVDVRPRESVVKGTVRDAAGRPVQGLKVTLTSPATRQETLTDSKGRFQFPALLAASYTVEVKGLVQTAYVDGRNQASLEFTLPPETPVKPIAQYLLFGPPQQVGTRANLLLAEDYVLAFTPTVGFSVDEALQAASVIIVGDVQAVSAETEDKLKAAGCQVTRLGGGPYAIEQAFAELLKSRGPSPVRSERLGGPARA